MNNVKLRPARLEDLPDLYEFEQGIVHAERPFDPTLKPGKINYYDLKELIEAEWAEVMVATIEEKVVASGYAKIKDASPYLKHDKYAYLGFMFVRPEHRGNGIIKMIISELKSWSKDRNINELRLDVYNDNIPALKSYEKFGFSRHLINMRIEV